MAVLLLRMADADSVAHADWCWCCNWWLQQWFQFQWTETLSAQLTGSSHEPDLSVSLHFISQSDHDNYTGEMMMQFWNINICMKTCQSACTSYHNLTITITQMKWWWNFEMSVFVLRHVSQAEFHMKTRTKNCQPWLWDLKVKPLECFTQKFLACVLFSEGTGSGWFKDHKMSQQAPLLLLQNVKRLSLPPYV